MLQPDKYPRMLGQSLVFEPDPFVVMVDDDNPWIEGLFFVVVLGLLVGLAQVIGGALLSASLPDSSALLEAMLQALEQAQPLGMSTAELGALSESIRERWPLIRGLYNYDLGWSRLLLLVAIPVWIIGQWLVYGLLCHLFAKALGGNGSLAQTLGVTALGVSPRILLLATAIPFVSVPILLTQGWGVLIAYRGLEVAHDLPMRRAAAAALGPVILLVLLLCLAAIVALFMLGWLGGRP